MRKICQLSCLALLLLALSGCGYIDTFFLPEPNDTAQELYENGINAMHEKRYDDAAEDFQNLKDRYPFSPYTTKAELSLADAYFLDQEYPSAADAYSDFESLHPRYEQIEYVLFQSGVSNYKINQAIDRPQTNIVKALEYFHRLKDTYPQSKYVPQAEAYIKKCRRLQASHEVFVADFYWKDEKYGAAYERYIYVTKHYADVPDLVAYAQKRAKVSWLKHQQQQSEKKREDAHGSWRSWFDWL